jgi:hypothetical protein
MKRPEDCQHIGINFLTVVKGVHADTARCEYCGKAWSFGGWSKWVRDQLASGKPRKDWR